MLGGSSQIFCMRRLRALLFYVDSSIFVCSMQSRRLDKTPAIYILFLILGAKKIYLSEELTLASLVKNIKSANIFDTVVGIIGMRRIPSVKHQSYALGLLRNNIATMTSLCQYTLAKLKLA